MSNYSAENNKKRMKRYKSPTKKVQNKVLFTVLRVIVAALLISALAVGGAGAGFYLSIVRSAPDVRDLHVGISGGSLDTVILDRFGNEIATLDAGVNRIFAEWDDIPQYLKDAIVAIEDERFFEHNGVDGRGMVRAVYQTLAHGNTQGASTITQQLIKNRLGLMRNTIETKLQEQYMAIQFEAMLVEELGSVEAAKQQILHDYLNIVHLGAGQDGVQAAARFYFNKDVSELTLSESAVLAAITSFPWQYNPARFPERNRRRQVNVLDSMLRLGMITPAQHREAYNDNVHDRIQQFRGEIRADDHIWSYFVDAVIDRLYEDFMAQGMSRTDAELLIFHGGLRVYTTMDPDIQNIMDEAFLNEQIFPSHWQDFEYFLEIRATVRNTTTGAHRNAERTSIHHGVRTTSRDDFDAFKEWALADIMSMEEELVGNYLFFYRPQPQSSMVIIDHNNGHVMGIAGQRGPKQSNRAFCRATRATR
ncbi:MAG: penicillin-binding protein, partial [Defluviitaleaceae bacterium]|nr:penicillin-binding protein [Defluviitaleaceae bacterium]